MKDFSMGSKKENAKQITVKVTRGKVYGFILGLILFGWLVGNLISDDVKELVGSEYKIECLNGSIEEIKQGLEYYCNEHYTVLYGRISNYQEVSNYIRGIENE